MATAHRFAIFGIANLAIRFPLSEVGPRLVGLDGDENRLRYYDHRSTVLSYFVATVCSTACSTHR